MKKCQYHNCKKELSGRQTVFCSLSCKNIVCVNRRRAKLKSMSLEYKGGKCSRCSYSKCLSALEFHHLEPEHKDFSLSSDGHTRSWDEIKNELDKCILVCANCHREEHERIKIEERAS